MDWEDASRLDVGRRLAMSILTAAVGGDRAMVCSLVEEAAETEPGWTIAQLLNFTEMFARKVEVLTEEPVEDQLARIAAAMEKGGGERDLE